LYVYNNDTAFVNLKSCNMFDELRLGF